MRVGERIKRLRETKGWSQRDLARAATIDHAWLSRLESGERNNLSLEGAKQVALALGCSIDYLAGMPRARAPRGVARTPGGDDDQPPTINGASVLREDAVDPHV